MSKARETANITTHDQTIDGVKTFSDNVIASSNVGIGTSSPAARLQVDTATNNDGISITNTSTANNTSKQARLLFRGTDTVGTGKDVGSITSVPEGGNYVGASMAFSTRSSDVVSESMRIDSSGNVGIGTSSPSTLLHLKSAGPAILTLEADSDNVTETDNARIELSQDGGAVLGRIGYANNTNSMEFWNEHTEHLIFGTSNTERMRIDGSGNVGIGTSSPEGKVHAERASGSAGWSYVTKATGVSNQSGFFMTASNNFECVLRDASNNLSFITNNGNNLVSVVDGSERMRIDSSGNVGIGTSSPSTNLAVDAGALGGTSGDRVDAFQLKTTTSNADFLNFSKIREADGTNWLSAGWRIQQKVDTTNQGYVQFNGSGNQGGLSFGTNNAERIRIDHSGNVGIGTSSPSAKLEVAGNITATGDITAYSDLRIKDNIRKIDDAISKVNLLSGYTFDRTDVDAPRQTGVIAQEVQSVLPEAVTETKDGTLTVAYGNMMGLMIEAIKEQQKQIDELKSKLGE